MTNFFKPLIILGLFSFSILAHGGEGPLNGRDGCGPDFLKVSEKSSAIKFSSQVEAEIFQKNVSLKGVKIIETDELQGPKSRAETSNYLKWLLEMTANTLSYKVSAKDLDLHGKFYLAQTLADGASLEFTYTGDKRKHNPIYRLSEINLVKKNGEKLLLNSSPMIDEGTRLRQPIELWTVEEEETGGGPIAISTNQIPASVTAQIRSIGGQNLKSITDQVTNGFSDPKNREVFHASMEGAEGLIVPIALSGPILVKYLRWLKRLGTIQADILEKMRHPSVNLLTLRYRVTDLLELFVSGSRSILSKVAVYAIAVIAGGSAIHSHLPAIAEHVPALAAMEQAKKGFAKNDFEQTLSQYSFKESRDSGHISMFVYKDENVMIQYFEKSEALIVSPLESKTPSFKIIEKKQDPAEYGRYLAIINSQN